MKSSSEILIVAKEVIRVEMETIKGLSDILDADFVNLLEHILNSKGRLIVTGIGKSAIISKKIVATLNSTGTSSLFIHTADAIHGDLGIISKNDIILCISNSGESAEIKALIPLIKNLGNKIIAMCGNQKSYLANKSDFIINTSITKEACPHNLTPTASTTAQLVMGDVLSICLLEMRGFSANDFASLHPGGILGKKLYLRVEDLYLMNEIPKVSEDASMNEVICEISSKRLGATAVLAENALKGIITDGDLRRMLHNPENINCLRAKDIMTSPPKTIEHNKLLVEALSIMRSNSITQLAVLKENDYVGIIHLHDILKEGIL